MTFLCIPKQSLNQLLSKNSECALLNTELGGVAAAGGGGQGLHSLHELARLLYEPSGGITKHYNAAGPSAAYSGIRLFKGVPPTVSDFRTNAFNRVYGSGLDVVMDWSFRSSDRLAHLPLNLAKTRAFGDVTAGQLSVNVDAAVATGTGTATWFVLIVMGSYYYSSSTVYGYGSWYGFAGTVGLNGSNADLPMYSTSIVAGQSYALGDVTLPIPTTFEI